MSDDTVFDELTGLEIAVVGMTGRFSGSKDLNAFWENLRNGVELITRFSDQELLAAGIDAATLSNPNYVKAGGTLDDIDLFDAAFFGYSPREAELMDPQQRVFLECAWEALEHAGYDSERYNGAIGVFAGVRINSYWLNLFLSQGMQGAGEFQTLLTNESDHLTMRVAYKLNLNGPALTVQTTCSTSLVAVHLACQSLLSGSCDIALAGGSSIPVPQKTGYWYQEGGAQSSDGHCRAFDAQASGMLIGSGVGVVVLKRLADALDDGDYIHAVIKGSAVNNDGAVKVGYTAPSVEGQAQVIRAAHMMAEIDPGTISYVEAHGTGTPVGDPIEIAALTRAFRAAGTPLNPCAIGSVKTNLGHLDAAAGVAGLIKTVLALKHHQIPASLHFETPNPRIDFASGPFYVNAKLAEWSTNGEPRRAGVSSFGIGGTNAHVVLEEAPPLEPSGSSRPWQLLVLSAKTSTALEQATANLAAYLLAQPDTNLADVAYTLQLGRKTFNFRRTLVCRDHEEAIALLKARDPKRMLTTIQEPQERPVAFLFPGQGAQYVGMGRELYDSEPIFRQWVDHCADLLCPHLDRDLRTVIYGASADGALLEQTQYAQSALFVIEYALAQLWLSWGVTPQAMLGHSIGEYVAATLAGVFSLEDALTLVAARGQLMQQLPAGSMLAVPLPEHELQPLLDATRDLAAVNGPTSCVVAGELTVIEALRSRLAERGVDSRVLHTSHAFHSAMMESIVTPFTEHVASVQLNPPRIPFLSNVTGGWISAAEATNPHYWARHLRQTVRFAAGLQELLREPSQVLLEVGPGRTLATFVRQALGSDSERIVLSSLRHPQDQQPDLALVLKTLGHLWLADVPVDWARFTATEQRRRVPLPTYPFERERYWIEAQTQETAHGQARSLQKQPDLADWFYLPSWKRSLPPALPALAEIAAQPRLWLLFVDATGLGLQLARRLEQAGQQVVMVKIGERFAVTDAHTYTINPTRSDDYAALLAELDALDQPLTTIVHLWNITQDDATRSREERVDRAQEQGFASLIRLTQALAAQNLTERLQIVVLSNNLLDVNGETAVCFEKATSLGPCKVIPQEYPNISCRTIDLTLPTDQDWQTQRLLDQLLAELLAPTSELIVAYRSNHRWEQTFEPIGQERTTAQPPRLRVNGVYVLYGGLQERGAMLARSLARTTQARLVLIEPITARQDDATRAMLQQLGASVLTLPADLDDPAAVAAAVAQAEQQLGPIHGLIDVIGAPEAAFTPIQELDLAAAQQAMRLTTRRLAVLEALTHDRKLDFCLVQSSLVAILGGLGTIGYCATNLLLDAFVYRQAQTEQTPWISVNWEHVRLEGEAAPEPGIGDNLAQLAITGDEAAQLFARLVALSPTPQIVVSSGNLMTRLEQWIRREQRVEQAGHEGAPMLYPRPNLRSAYVAPENEIERRLAAIWQQLFGIEHIGIHDNFFELGGDSLLATQLVSRVQDTFQIELPLRSLFETATLAELAVVIAERLLEQIDPDLLAEIAELD